MHHELAEHTDIDGNRPRREGYGIGHGRSGDVIFQGAVKLYYLGVDQVHHTRMKREVKDMDVGQEYLIEQPGYIADKSDPAEKHPGFDTSGKKQVMTEGRDQETCRDTQCDMKAIEFS